MGKIGAIQAQIRSALGAVPPMMTAVQDDPVLLEGMWQTYQAGYLHNPLPALFKEQFLSYVARFHQRSACLILQSCILKDIGQTSREITLLLSSRLPRGEEICQALASGGRNGRPEDWPKTGSDLEMAILWAAVRIWARRDRAGACQKSLGAVLGRSSLSRLLMLITFAQTMRIWTESVADVELLSDDRVHRHREALLIEAPALEDLWRKTDRGLVVRAPRLRKRTLLAEIARHDRDKAVLEASEKRFRAVVQNLPYPVMVYAEDGEVMILNRAWVEASGWGIRLTPTVEAWLEQSRESDMVWNPDDVRVLEETQEVIVEGEHSLVTRGGQSRTWEFSSASLGLLPDGRRAVIRMASDQTDHKRLGDALWDTNRRMVMILESITDGFISVDRAWRFVYVNQAAERIVGKDREQLIGQTVWDILVPTGNHELASQIRESAEQNRVLHNESFLKEQNRWIHYHLYPSVEGVSVYFEDVTEAKRIAQEMAENQERLRQITSKRDMETILRASPLGIIASDMDGNVTIWNHAAEGFFGWRSDETIGKPLPVIPADQWARFEKVREKITAGHRVRGAVIPCCRKDGSTVLSRVAISAIRDESGKPTGILAIHSDDGEDGDGLEGMIPGHP